MLSPTNYFWYAYGFWATLFVLSAMTSFVGTRADFVIVRTKIYSGVMMCYGFRGLAIGPVTVYGVMMWYGIWYVLMIWCVCDMMCLEIVRRFETFWSYDVLWHQRRGGDHVPIPYTWFDLHLYVRLPHRFALFTMLVCLFFLTPAVFVISVPSALHTQYFSRNDPRFFGGCVSCPQVQKIVWVVLQCRLLILLCWRAPLDSEPTFGIYLLSYVCVWYICGCVGTAGPCPVLCSVLFRGL